MYFAAKHLLAGSKLLAQSPVWPQALPSWASKTTMSFLSAPELVSTPRAGRVSAPQYAMPGRTRVMIPRPGGKYVTTAALFCGVKLDSDMAITLKDLDVKLFTDGADKAQILEMAKQPWIRGFTTNPSLMKAARVSDYVAYARDLVAAVPDRHISFEVFSDDIAEMVG